MTTRTITSTKVNRLPRFERAVVYDGSAEVFVELWPEQMQSTIVNTRTTERQTPGWRRRLLRGDNATTFLSGERRRFEWSPGYAYKHVIRLPPFQGLAPTSSEVTGSFFSPDFSGFGSIEASQITSSNNLALAGFVKKVLSAQHQMQSLVSAGELGETLRMLRRPGEAFRKRLWNYVQDARRNFRRVKGRKPYVQRRVLRDTWLEANFGWAPFVSDIEDARKAYAALYEYKPWKYIRFNASVSKVADDRSVGFSNHDSESSIVISARQLTQHDVLTIYNGVVDLEVDGLGFRLARQNFGFDWQNFFPTVWELIPYSFLVDYFSNIGEMIAASSLNTSRLRWVAKTVKQSRHLRVYDHQVSMPINQYEAIKEKSFRPDSLRYFSETVLRSNYTGSLVPDFQVEIPGLLSDAKKWLNMAALFRFMKRV